MKTIPQIAEEVAMIGPRIGRKIIADIARVADIPHAQLFLIIRLSHHGSTRFADIRHELRVSAPTATGIVTRLERAGYVTRVQDVKDRRLVLVALTAEGNKLAGKIRGIVVKRWTHILGTLSRQDAEKYLDILRKISEAI
jgi:DNA-binding MarR family transcriptional regulator